MMNSVLVWITCRNYESFVAQAFGSVHLNARNLDSPFGVVVRHDDCGGDHPIGVAPMRNAVLDHPEQPDYVIFLDADDLLPPNYVAEMLKMARGDECVVYTDTSCFGHYLNGRFRADKRVNFETMFWRNTLNVSSLIPMTAFRRVGGFDPTLPVMEDWELWLRMLVAGVEFRYCPAVSLCYRNHGLSRSTAVAKDPELDIKLRHLVMARDQQYFNL